MLAQKIQFCKEKNDLRSAVLNTEFMRRYKILPVHPSLWKSLINTAATVPHVDSA